ncbi:MAG: lysophospholipid acyltransferase family protein [Metamycoplasmataceae bacterium]
MKKNYNAILWKPWFDSRARKCKRITLKSRADKERYPLQWRNDYLVKKIAHMLKILKVEISVKGFENLGTNGPAILMGNHQDYSDPLVLAIALAKQTEEKDDKNKIITFLAKEELKYHPGTRWPLEMIDVFFLERDQPRKSLETYNNFGKFVKQNKTYGAIFPEGTRNKVGGISAFKPAAMKVAQKEFIPIIPFTINNSVTGFDWKRNKKLKVEIIFHKKLSPSSFINQSSSALAQRVEDIVRSSFVKPEYEFRNSTNEKKEKKFLKAKAKYEKEENKKQAKIFKENKKIKDQERKIAEQEEKEIKKYLEKEEKKKQK